MWRFHFALYAKFSSGFWYTATAWGCGRQQPVSAYRPAGGRANQKAAAKLEMRYQCTYTVQWCICISWSVCNHLYTEHQLHKLCITCIYMFVHWHDCMYIIMFICHDSNHVFTCIYTYIRVRTMYMHVYHSSDCTYDVRTMYRRIYTNLETSLASWL
jgi:hypothetical protein